MSLAAPPATDDVAPPPPSYVTKSYGEPRFHCEGDVAALAFAADGSVWSVDETGVLRHWAESGESLARHFLSDLETLWAFDATATLLASANDDLLVWDVADGQLLHRVAQHCWVTAIAFTPDGRTIATGHDDGRVRFWDARGQSLVGEIAAHPAAVSALAFSPDGQTLVTAGEDRAVKTWHAVTHKPLGVFTSHTDRVPSLSWSADGSLFASAGWDTSARVWKPSTPDPVMLLNSHSDQVHVVAFAPEGGTLASADSDYDIHLWSDPTKGTVGKVLRGHASEIKCLAFDRSGSRLASAGADRVVHLWDTATGQLVAGPNPSGKHGLCAYRSGTAVRVASTAGPTLRVWDAASGQTVAPTGDGPAYCVAASTDGRWLAAGGTDHVTRLYDRGGAGELRRLEATKPPVGAAAFSPDGRTLALASPADGLVWLWDTTNPTADAKMILIGAADGCTLETIAFHPDGNRLAVGGIDYLGTGERDGAVCVWDLTKNEIATQFDSGVYAVAIDPAGRFVAGAGVNDVVLLWDLDADELAFELEGHQQKVNTVAFDPEGSFVISGGDDGTLRAWDVLSGRLMVVREFESPVQSLTFGPDLALYAGLANTTCVRLDFKKVMED